MADSISIQKAFRGDRYPLNLVKSRISSKPLADYFKRMRTEYMDQPPDPEQDEHLAELIYSIAHDIAYMPGREIIRVE